MILTILVKVCYNFYGRSLFMKKVLFTIVSFFLVFSVANAAVRTETLQEACEIEGLDCVSKKENDESLPNIYLFRGDGCPYCNELIQFIDSIIDDYQVNVVVYEVKDNKDNWNFYKKVGKEFDFTPSGYPYLVVGEETFDGYASSDDEDIKTAIEELQNSEEPYDVVKELENTPVDDESNDKAVIVIILCAAIVMGGYLIFKIKNK